jgi:ribosome maturation factor RimP
MAGNREAIIDKVTAIAERVAALEGMEIASVELAGAGRNRVLRVYIDRPPAPGETVPLDQPYGVSLGDCELMSHKLGEVLDADENIIPGEGYQLEVSSPGVERKLTKPRDFERFRGHKVKIRLREPLENQKVWRGTLGSFDGSVIHLAATAPVKTSLDIQLAQVERANVEFNWK